MRIKVTRAFYYGNEVKAIGEVIEVPDSFGRELIYMKKAVETTEKSKAEPQAK